MNSNTKIIDLSYLKEMSGNNKDIMVEKPLIDEIYGIIDKQAKKMGIQDVPVVFDLEGLPALD